MAAMCGARGQVVPFEPDLHARRLLQRNLRLNPGIKMPKIVSMAVSDAPGGPV
jgi:hypothetical protein